jgi:hypothetical protein
MKQTELRKEAEIRHQDANREDSTPTGSGSEGGSPPTSPQPAGRQIRVMSTRATLEVESAKKKPRAGSLGQRNNRGVGGLAQPQVSDRAAGSLAKDSNRGKPAAAHGKVRLVQNTAATIALSCGPCSGSHPDRTLSQW